MVHISAAKMGSGPPVGDPSAASRRGTGRICAEGSGSTPAWGIDLGRRGAIGIVVMTMERDHGTGERREKNAGWVPRVASGPLHLSIYTTFHVDPIDGTDRSDNGLNRVKSQNRCVHLPQYVLIFVILVKGGGFYCIIYLFVNLTVHASTSTMIKTAAL